jgi:GntR family transcriptional regulator
MPNNTRIVARPSTAAPARSLLVQRIVRIKEATREALTPAARMVLRSLADHAGDGPECWPSVRTLAQGAGVSVRQAQRILRELVAGGWITAQPRFRQDGSQTSTLYRWIDPAAVPGSSCPADPDVTPPLTPVSPLENIRGKDSKKHDVQDVVCVQSPAKRKTPATPNPTPLSIAAAATPVEVIPKPENTSSPAAAPAVQALPADYQPDTEVAVAAPLAAVLPAVLATTAKRATPKRATAGPERPAHAIRRRWLQIDPSRLSDGRYAIQCHAAAVAAGLLTAGEAARLTWLAVWCEVLSKSRRGAVRNPAAVLRWLLDNPKALAAYPSQASEDKARSILSRMAAGV